MLRWHPRAEALPKLHRDYCEVVAGTRKRKSEAEPEEDDGSAANKGKGKGKGKDRA